MLWLAEFFLTHDVDLHARGYNGATALHFTAYSAHCQEYLLDVNVTDDFGRTVLHYVALSGTSASDRVLKKAGAKEFVLDTFGLRANDYEGASHQDERHFDEMKYWSFWIRDRYSLRLEDIQRLLTDSALQKKKHSDNWLKFREERAAEDRRWWLVSDDEDSDEETEEQDSLVNDEMEDVETEAMEEEDITVIFSVPTSDEAEEEEDEDAEQSHMEQGAPDNKDMEWEAEGREDDEKKITGEKNVEKEVRAVGRDDLIELEMVRFEHRQYLDRGGAQLARNKVCWCGSNRKFRRCHGR